MQQGSRESRPRSVRSPHLSRRDVETRGGEGSPPVYTATTHTGAASTAMESPYSPHDHLELSHARSPPLVPLPERSPPSPSALHALDDPANVSPYYDAEHAKQLGHPAHYAHADVYDPRMRAPPPPPSYLHHHHPQHPPYSHAAPAHPAGPYYLQRSVHESYGPPAPMPPTPGDYYHPQTSPAASATSPYGPVPESPYGPGAPPPHLGHSHAHAGMPPFYAHHQSHRHPQPPAQEYYGSGPTPRSPYDPAASTSAYPNRRRTSPSSSSGGPSPNLDTEAARREEYEREAGRREIEERERIKHEAAWRRKQARVNSEYHALRRREEADELRGAGGGHLPDDEGEDGGEEADAQDLDILLREVRGDLAPVAAEKRADRRRSEGDQPGRSEGATSLPWQDREAESLRSRSSTMSASDPTTIRPADGAHASIPRPDEDAPSSAAQTRTTAGAENSATLSESRPHKRMRRSHSSGNDRSGSSDAERICGWPRRSCVEYAQSRALPIDVETEVVDQEPQLGERSSDASDADWTLFGQVS